VRLSEFRVLTFDVVGTLIDFESGIVSYVQSVTGDEFSRQEVLGAFGAAEREQQATTPGLPFTEMLAPVYRRMGLPNGNGEADGFRLSIPRWPAFPDSVEALRRLGRRFRLVAMTNADNWALAAMARTLGEPFDDTVTCEDVGVNKPDPQVFAYCLGRQSAQGFEQADILHVAQSQYHDIGVAKRLGYATCWIERRKGEDGFGATPVPEVVTDPDWHFATLAELADAVERESGA
jgi:putative hydrolase of the HAD superfamily